MNKNINKTKYLKKRLTKKSRKYRKEKKYYVGGEDSNNSLDDNSNSIEKEGVIGIVQNKASNFLENAGDYAAKKGLRLLGLQSVNENEATEKLDANVEKFSNAASGLVSQAQRIGNDVVNVVDKGSAALIENINDVLESPKIENSVTEAAKETGAIAGKLLQKFNEGLSSPEVKAATKETLNNVADYANIAINALDEPLDKAIDELNQAGTQALSGSVAGIVKVGTDALGAIPGFGAIIDIGKMINDGSKAAASVVEAGSQAAKTFSDLETETLGNIKKELDDLKKKKELASKILDRTSQSINDFNDPLNYNKPNLKGGSKKKRNLFTNFKTKRVRFVL